MALKAAVSKGLRRFVVAAPLSFCYVRAQDREPSDIFSPVTGCPDLLNISMRFFMKGLLMGRGGDEVVEGMPWIRRYSPEEVDYMLDEEGPVAAMLICIEEYGLTPELRRRTIFADCNAQYSARRSPVLREALSIVAETQELVTCDYAVRKLEVNLMDEAAVDLRSDGIRLVRDVEWCPDKDITVLTGAQSTSSEWMLSYDAGFSAEAREMFPGIAVEGYIVTLDRIYGPALAGAMREMSETRKKAG